MNPSHPAPSADAKRSENSSKADARDVEIRGKARSAVAQRILIVLTPFAEPFGSIWATIALATTARFLMIFSFPTSLSSAISRLRPLLGLLSAILFQLFFQEPALPFIDRTPPARFRMLKLFPHAVVGKRYIVSDCCMLVPYRIAHAFEEGLRRYRRKDGKGFSSSVRRRMLQFFEDDLGNALSLAILVYVEHVDVARAVQASESNEDAALFDSDRLLPFELADNLQAMPIAVRGPCIELIGSVILDVDRVNRVAEQMGCCIEAIAGKGTNLKASDVVAVVDQMVVEPVGFAQREVALVFLDEFVYVHLAGEPSLDYVRVARNVIAMDFQMPSCHDQAAELNLRKVLWIEVGFPIEGDVASLDDKVLLVLDGGFDDLLDDTPKIGDEKLVILGSQLGLAAAYETHLQKVDREHRIVVALCQLLR